MAGRPVRTAYVDSSLVVACIFEEPEAAAAEAAMSAYDRLVASDLLAAELLASARREDLALPLERLAVFDWLLPQRPLHREFNRVLDVGFLRGADLWHVACASYLMDREELDFLTLDRAQGRIACSIGLRVPEVGER